MLRAEALVRESLASIVGVEDVRSATNRMQPFALRMISGDDTLI
jgi:hypothetical protein